MTFVRRQTDRRDLFELSRRAKMPVGEFIAYMGNRTLAETSYRVAVAEDLEIPLAELGGRMTASELQDWALLYEIEAEAHAIEAENARRRRGK